MATIVRVSLSRVLQFKVPKSLLSNGSEKSGLVRRISGKSVRCTIPTPRKPNPYPYHDKSYTVLNYLFDKTTPRFDENTKLIVVEGPIAAGKSAFAKELADDLAMLYLPEANLDMIYINSVGYDLKKLDCQLPESMRSFDVENFLLNPNNRKTATFQMLQYGVKYEQYIDALAHILSTGQGVVLDRCVYSDFVFVEAMYKQGYLSKGARSVYYDVRKNTIGELMRPHLVIYLDVPVCRVIENIKKRNIPVEAKSTALTQEYLQTMETYYKQHYLKQISSHAELLVYDWSESGEVEVVVEDIERINFDKFDDQESKFKDWVHHMEEEWGVLRHTYADKKDFLMSYMNVPRFDVPELVLDAEDCKEAQDIIDNAPGMKFADGYDASQGDTGILFKTSSKNRDTLPLRERRWSKCPE